MSKTLFLKKRPIRDEISMSSAVLEEILRKPDKEVVETFRKALAARDWTVHDKRWLELIANHVQDGGNSAFDLAPWIGLRTRIANLDENREGTFTLSDAQVKMIQRRLKDKDFKINALSAQFDAFLYDFCLATEWHYDENESENWFGAAEESVPPIQKSED